MRKSISFTFFFIAFFILNFNLTFAQSEESLELLGEDFLMALKNDDMSLIEPYFPKNTDLEIAMEDVTNRTKAEEAVADQGGIDAIVAKEYEEFENEFASITEDLAQNYEDKNSLLDNARFETETMSSNEFKTLKLGSLAIITEDFVIEVEAIHLGIDRGWVLTRFDF